MKVFKWIVIIIVLAILALVSISPFLSDTLALSDDGNLHIYRSIVLDDAIRNDGSLYPRYASALAYGYGAPLFNYFPPTSYYPTVIFHTIGFDWVSAWKASMIVYVLLAGLGAYLWARQWLDDTGAFITASAYIYAPYTLFDTVTRGSSNEFAGMALLPFALWGFTKLARSGKRSDFLLAVISYALFIMAHNVMTLYGTLFLIAYCLLLLISSQNKFRVLWQMASAGVLALLMTAFFWLPALSETDFVKINGVLENLDFIDVTNTLRTLADVFALPQTADPSQLQAIVPISFSWVLLILAVIGFFLPQPFPTQTAPKRNILGLHLLLFAVVGIVTFSQLTISADAWQSVRLLQYSQFAWRPMSIGALALALLAGIGGSYVLRLIRSRPLRLASFGIILALIMLYSIPWLYRPQITLVAETVQDAQNYEVATQQTTLSSYGEYLPAQTDATALDQTYYQQAVSRIQENDALTIVSIEESGTELRAEIELNQASTLSFNWLNVAGWQARIDGEEVEVQSIGSAGFVGVDVPSGTHTLRVWYAGTAIQNNATLLSIVAGLAVIGLIFIFPKPRPNTEGNATYPSLEITLMVCLVGLAVFSMKALLIDRTNNPLRSTRYQDGIIQNVDSPLSVNFDNQIRLLGANYDPTVISGGNNDISLFWTVSNEGITNDYSTRVQVINSQGIVIAEDSSFYPAGLATSNWLENYYLEDSIKLHIPDYTPPLSYQLQVSVFDSATGQTLDILNEAGNPIGIASTLSPITVTRPNTQADYTDLPLPLLTADNIDLLSVSDLPEQAQVGDAITFSWLWQAFSTEADFTPELVWSNDTAVSVSPLVQGYPISDWQISDTWRGYHQLYVPPTLDAGDYALSIRIGEQRVSLNQIMTVTVPERNFEPPEFMLESGTHWQNGIQLLGYDTGDSSITLQWQTQATITDNLRLFVQVFGAEGQMLALTDTIPVNFQRPTTSWVTEEFITTEHQFGDLADGTYQLIIGWYNPQTDERVRLVEGDSDVLALEYQP
ncbi:MAG: hypothetical protein Phog2KO_13990 [Phototrophicaceae bacterium]